MNYELISAITEQEGLGIIWTNIIETNYCRRRCKDKRYCV